MWSSVVPTLTSPHSVSSATEGTVSPSSISSGEVFPVIWISGNPSSAPIVMYSPSAKFTVKVSTSPTRLAALIMVALEKFVPSSSTKSTKSLANVPVQPKPFRSIWISIVPTSPFTSSTSHTRPMCEL